MIKEFYTYQPPHGYFVGAVKKNGICPTIDATIAFWHTLIIEKVIIDEKRRNKSS